MRGIEGPEARRKLDNHRQLRRNPATDSVATPPMRPGLNAETKLVML